jgi:hypothetical protein
MAIKKNVFFQKTGFEGKLIAKDAYWKIENIAGNKNQMNIEIYANVDGKQIERFVCVFTPSLDGSNFIKQAYEHLKTLPAFAGAIDC